MVGIGEVQFLEELPQLVVGPERTPGKGDVQFDDHGHRLVVGRHGFKATGCRPPPRPRVCQCRADHAGHERRRLRPGCGGRLAAAWDGTCVFIVRIVGFTSACCEFPASPLDAHEVVVAERTPRHADPGMPRRRPVGGRIRGDILDGRFEAVGGLDSSDDLTGRGATAEFGKRAKDQVFQHAQRRHCHTVIMVVDRDCVRE